MINSIVIDHIKKTIIPKTILKDISFILKKNECTAILGESGSGKTTLANAILNTVDYSGNIYYNNILRSGYSNLAFARIVQKIFQNPYESLNPKMRIRDILSEPFLIHNMSIPNQFFMIDKHLLDKFPNELSGGQQQQVAISRAISLEPSFLICDEITSSLDIEASFKIFNIIKDLKKKMGILFISHDLNMVKRLADNILILKDGYLKNYE
jgi:peptide/nickel transport system ATP-binding protein